nr:double-strand break repair protein AddB [uncultured Neokomagataea sp.]
MTIVSVAPGLPFLDRVVREWLAQDVGGLRGGHHAQSRCGQVGYDQLGHSVAGDAGPGLILVPSRRAGRALMEAFLRVLDGQAALLPRVVAMNDVDESGLGLSGGVEAELPPAVDKQQRLAVLSYLILQTPIVSLGMDRTKGIDRAWPLAKALAELMDEAERSGVDLATSLPEAVEEQFSEHWQQTLKFLEIVTSVWPQWLQEAGLMNPVARQVARLKAQAALWDEQPPQTPVWAVGFADGSAAVVDVLAAVARMPQGCVVLPGVDLTLDDELWGALPPAHPQAGLKEIIDTLGVARGDVEEWGFAASADSVQLRLREGVMRDVMLPERGIAVWGQDLTPRDVTGLYRLPAQDQQQEAQAIALVLRDAVEVPGKTAALITPDRSLARRVGTELQRFGVVADDSAGMSLAEAPQAVFLRLIAQAVEAELSPVALLAMVKHPLAAMGQSPGVCRASARRLERLVLRGPAPVPEIAGLRAALHALDQERLERDPGLSADAPDVAEGPLGFVERLEQCLAPLLGIAGAVPLPELLGALIQSAEALAAVEAPAMDGEAEASDYGASRLWVGEEGEALAQHLAGLMEHTALLPPQRLGHLDSFLNTALSGETLTGARAYRGGEELAHPRVSILGVLEARLQAFDVVVLGGLNETVWPPAADSGPWLSRPMRARVGLAPPERQTGISAHDFVSSVLAGGEVVFSNAVRRDGAPGTPARWLVRMEAFLKGRGQTLPVHHALGWQAELDHQPEEYVTLLAPPMPRPPVALRPRKLSITDIETLKLDPYSIYAKHILKLRALPPLEEGVEHADFGMIVHDAMEDVLKQFPQNWPENALAHVRRAFLTALDEAAVRPALANWWRPRLMRIAEWVSEQEKERRLAEPAAARYVEVDALYQLMTELGPFAVTGRADRVDIDAASGATVFDYKTGTPPSGTSVEEGWSIQLVLEGALLAAGAFSKVPVAETKALLYWHLSGNAKPGEERRVPSARSKVTPQDLISNVIDQLRSLIVQYEDPQQAYRSEPWAGKEMRYTDYALLARVPEWKAASQDDEGAEG